MNKFSIILFLLISTAQAGIPQNENYIPGGFANNLTLKDSLTIFVPNNWEIRAPRSVLKKKISWVGDIGWYDILAKVSLENKIDLIMEADKRVITLLNSDPNTKQGLVQGSILQPKMKKVRNLTASAPLTPTRDSYIKQNQTSKASLPTSVKEEVSFLSGFTKSVSGLFSDNKKTTPNVSKIIKPNINYDTLIIGLLDDLGLKTKILSTSRTYNEVDNTVNFSFTYLDLTVKSTQKHESFIVFNGVEVYSAILVYPADKEIAKAWYSKNFTHPSLDGKPLIKPIKSITKQHKSNVISKELFSPPVITTLPSFLERKEFLAIKGDMLSDVIRKWSKSEGIDVVWEPLTDFKITREIRFFNNYLESIKSILLFYNSTAKPLQTRFFIKNKTLLVQYLRVIYRKHNGN